MSLVSAAWVCAPAVSRSPSARRDAGFVNHQKQMTCPALLLKAQPRSVEWAINRRRVVSIMMDVCLDRCRVSRLA